jgi:hypothetical protein
MNSSKARSTLTDVFKCCPELIFSLLPSCAVSAIHIAILDHTLEKYDHISFELSFRYTVDVLVLLERLSVFGRCDFSREASAE